MKFNINRNKWLRGEGAACSKLLRASDGKMCCLGFFGVACGVPTDELLEVRCPQKEESTWRANGDWLFDNKMSENITYPIYSVEGTQLMKVNDRIDLEGKDRENEVKKIFARHGITVRFTGKK